MMHFLQGASALSDSDTSLLTFHYKQTLEQINTVTLTFIHSRRVTDSIWCPINGPGKWDANAFLLN